MRKDSREDPLSLNNNPDDKNFSWPSDRYSRNFFHRELTFRWFSYLSLEMNAEFALKNSKRQTDWNTAIEFWFHSPLFFNVYLVMYAWFLSHLLISFDTEVYNIFSSSLYSSPLNCTEEWTFPFFHFFTIRRITKWGKNNMTFFFFFPTFSFSFHDSPDDAKETTISSVITASSSLFFFLCRRVIINRGYYSRDWGNRVAETWLLSRQQLERHEVIINKTCDVVFFITNSLSWQCSVFLIIIYQTNMTVSSRKSITQPSSSSSSATTTRDAVILVIRRVTHFLSIVTLFSTIIKVVNYILGYNWIKRELTWFQKLLSASLLYILYLSLLEREGDEYKEDIAWERRIASQAKAWLDSGRADEESGDEGDGEEEARVLAIPVLLPCSTWGREGAGRQRTWEGL